VGTGIYNTNWRDIKKKKTGNAEWCETTGQRPGVNHKKLRGPADTGTDTRANRGKMRNLHGGKKKAQKVGRPYH